MKTILNCWKRQVQGANILFYFFFTFLHIVKGKWKKSFLSSTTFEYLCIELQLIFFNCLTIFNKNSLIWGFLTQLYSFFGNCMVNLRSRNKSFIFPP